MLRGLLQILGGGGVRGPDALAQQEMPMQTGAPEGSLRDDHHPELLEEEPWTEESCPLLHTIPKGRVKS